MAEYASNGKGNLGVTLGAIGTGLGLLGGMGNGLANLGGFGGGMYGGYQYGMYNPDFQLASRESVDNAIRLAQKDSEIALLKSEQNTEIKIADVYERLITRINADQRAQADWNTAQAVYNATNTAGIGCLRQQVAELQDLTKLVIPAHNVCPRPMERYNSWTAPVSANEPAATPAVTPAT